MNAALARTIYDLAYNQALDKAIDAETRNNREAFESWEHLAIEIAHECVKEFGERPAVI